MVLFLAAGNFLFAQKFYSHTQNGAPHIFFSQTAANPIHWYVFSLPLEERAAQLFIAGIDGKDELHPSTRTFEYAPGAFLFFGYNIASEAKNVIAFTTSIHNTFALEKHLIPPMLVIDHEGGNVNRLRHIASPLPAAAEIAKKLTPQQARYFYAVAGLQLKALGFHLNLAPIAEAENDDNALFLDTRSFGTAENVQHYVFSAVSGYADAGIKSTVKHFPGNTGEDPHFGLPTLSISLSQFKTEYLYPFRQIMLSKPDAILMSHIIVPAVDSHYPACLSSVFIEDILRGSFAYEGLILSDDLFMGAMKQSGFPPEKAVIAAVDAGITMLMLSTKNISKATSALVEKAQQDVLFLHKINEATAKIIQFKLASGLLQFDGNKIVASSILNADERLKKFVEAYSEGQRLYSEFFQQ